MIEFWSQASQYFFHNHLISKLLATWLNFVDNCHCSRQEISNWFPIFIINVLMSRRSDWNLTTMTFESPWNSFCKMDQACFNVVAAAIREKGLSWSGCLKNKCFSIFFYNLACYFLRHDLQILVLTSPKDLEIWVLFHTNAQPRSFLPWRWE